MPKDGPNALQQHLIAGLNKRRMQVRGIAADDIATLAAELPGIQLGYLTSKSIIKVDAIIGVDRREAARTEAIRIIASMLGHNADIARAFLEQNFEVVVVPSYKRMTDLPAFAQLRGRTTDDGRVWDTTRGAGFVAQTADGIVPAVYNGKIFVAITEENLRGQQSLAPGAGGCYTRGYSTTAHEFAHTIHRFGLSQTQRDLIDRCFKRKRSDSAGNELRIVYANNDYTRPPQLYYDGNINEIHKILERPWTDGVRLKAAASPAAQVYRIATLAGGWRKLGAFQVDVKLRHQPMDNYASSSVYEYFAQLACAYLGANAGVDPLTNHPRQNSRAFIEANEPAEMVRLIHEVFGDRATLNTNAV